MRNNEFAVLVESTVVQMVHTTLIDNYEIEIHEGNNTNATIPKEWMVFVWMTLKNEQDRDFLVTKMNNNNEQVGTFSQKEIS